MVFKRRDKRPIWQVVKEFFWPRGGWARAAHYVKHRLRRLPDSPARIARGIFAGVFTTFTPFFGLHFIVAALIAFVMRGNILAALLSTFFGNPLTYVPIAMASLRTGYWMLGLEWGGGNVHGSLGQKFAEAWWDLKHNFLAMFNADTADWHGLHLFYDEVFFPFMIGGILPGLVTAAVCYYISLPLIRAYQHRRKGVIKAKLAALRKKAQAKADELRKHD